jgi:hypothetical protein
VADYQPPYRRPISRILRATAQGAVRLCVRLKIHPNTVSLTSIVAAAAAGICFWPAGSLPALLIPAVGFCYLRLWLNMLDGMVALASGQASRKPNGRKRESGCSASLLVPVWMWQESNPPA